MEVIDFNEDENKQIIRKYWAECQKTYYSKHKEKVDSKNRFNYFIRTYGKIPPDKVYIFENYDRYKELVAKTNQLN